MRFKRGVPAKNKGKGAGYLWLLNHVNFDGPDCLIWPMNRDDKGYGTLGYNGKVWKASRLMCTLAHGDPPTPKHQAAHSCACGHDGCVHPKHLSWKTPAGNTADAIAHGHYGYNSAGRTGKLTHDKASEIRALVGTMTNVELGLVYGVHAETIAKIRRGQTWRKVA